MKVVFILDDCEHLSSIAKHSNIIKQFPSSYWLSEKEFLKGKLKWFSNNNNQILPENFNELSNWSTSKTIFHILRGDFSPSPVLLKQIVSISKIVTTVHQPVCLLNDTYLNTLNLSDLILTVSSSEIELLKNRGISKPILYLPHSIELVESEYKDLPSNEIICAGEHFRDWNCANDVFKVLRDKYNLKCRIIIPRFHHYVPILKDVNISICLSNTEYYKAIHNASVLFLPLTYATSNNLLLEAMHLKCPIACSDLLNTREYLGQAGIYFKNSDIQSAISAVLSIYYDKELRTTLITEGTNQVKKFNCSLSAESLIKVYSDLVNSEIN